MRAIAFTTLITADFAGKFLVVARIPNLFPDLKFGEHLRLQASGCKEGVGKITNIRYIKFNELSHEDLLFHYNPELKSPGKLETFFEKKYGSFDGREIVVLIDFEVIDKGEVVK